MSNSIFKTFAVAAGSGLALGFAHAQAAPSLPFAGGSALFAESGSEAAREPASSALEGMMARFIRIDAEETAAAGVEAESTECPEEKKTKLAESEKDEKSDKDAPQGPEPIYFAF